VEKAGRGGVELFVGYPPGGLTGESITSRGESIATQLKSKWLEPVTIYEHIVPYNAMKKSLKDQCFK